MQTAKVLKRLENLIQSRRLVAREVLEREPDLVRKWPEYAFMSPLEATVRFFREYQTAYKRAYARYIDDQRAEKMVPAAHVNFRVPSGQLTALWKARQYVDSLRLSYDFYLHHWFEFVTRRRREHLPQPNQLCPTEKQIEAFGEFLNDLLFNGGGFDYMVSKLPHQRGMTVENFRGLPAQVAFRDLVTAAIDGWGGRARSLGETLLIDRYLSLDNAKRVFGEDRVEMARQTTQSAINDGIASPEPIEKLDTLMQSCLGVVGPTGSGCVSCPQAKLCAGLAERADRGVLQKAGSLDPIKDAKRRKGRDRVAVHRARKAALAGATAATTRSTG